VVVVNPNSIVLIKRDEYRQRDTRDASSQKKRPQHERDHLQAKERDLRRIQPCQNLDLGYLPFKTMRKYISAYTYILFK
jgi:hypothetical protein